jgi:hypothetical protein
MRKVILAAAVVGCCVFLSSCGGRPEDAFLGSWKGTVDGDVYELEFLEKDIFIVKGSDGMNGGKWSMGPNGEAILRVGDDDKGSRAVRTGEGKIIVRPEEGSEAYVFERAGKK